MSKWLRIFLVLLLGVILLGGGLFISACPAMGAAAKGAREPRRHHLGGRRSFGKSRHPDLTQLVREAARDARWKVLARER